MRLRQASLCCCLIGLAVPAACMGADSVAAPRPLRLALEGNALRIEPMRQNLRSSATAMPRRGPPTDGSPASVRQQALQGLLSPPEQVEALSSRDASPFRFRRQGNVGSELGRDLGRSYRTLCDNASRKIWDDPNGKRVKFDVAGKPGVAFEIPIR